VKVAVTVQVAIGGAVTKARRGKPKADSLIFKGEVMLIQEPIVGNGGGRHFFQEFLTIEAPASYLGRYLFAGEKVEKILVGQIFTDAVADKKVFPAIVVKIEPQCPPTPVCRLHA